MTEPRNVVVTGITEKGYKRLAEYALDQLNAAHAVLDEAGVPRSKYDELTARIRQLMNRRPKSD